MITVNNLTFDYPGKRALDNVSFEIKPQTITALVGPNGAGKTTLLRCLCALDIPIKGDIIIDGIDVQKAPRKVHRICRFLPDFYGHYDALTVKQCLMFTAMSYHLKDRTNQVEQVIKKLELQNYENKRAGTLSRGWRQRLAIAQAILPQPKVLFLDEPASGLDPEARMHLSKLLKQLQHEGMTLIVSSHILAELEHYSSDMLVIRTGSVIKHCPITASPKDSQPPIKITLNVISDEIIERLKNISGITVITIEDKVAILQIVDDALEYHNLLKILINKDIPVNEVQKLKPSMAEVYMQAQNNTGEKDDTE